LGEKMRLDKLLALLGEGTRSEIKAMVRAGRVTVDGAGARDAGMQVDGAQSDVRLDGRRLCYKAVRHVMLNKPSGVLTAARDPKQPTVLDLLPPAYRACGCMPVGRLDKDTSGLLLLTTDGELAHRLLSPKRHVWKCYEATVDGPLNAQDAAAFAAGLELSDFTALPAELEILRSSPQEAVAQVRVREGKFHQVRRMFAARGRTVTALRRLSLGPLTLDASLQPGEYRELTAQELTELLAAVSKEDAE